jgi:hypothetical protein
MGMQFLAVQPGDPTEVPEGRTYVKGFYRSRRKWSLEYRNSDLLCKRQQKIPGDPL